MGVGRGGGEGWVAFDIELRTIEDLNSRRWQINPGIFCDISNFLLWLLARYSPEKLFWFLPKAVCLVTLPLISASPLRNLSNFLLWNPESCALESGIQIKEYGMQLKIWIRNPNSSYKLRNPVRNSESMTVLHWILLHGLKQTSGLLRSVSPYETRSVLCRIVLWTEWTVIGTLPFLAFADFHCHAVKNKHQKGV